MKTAVRILTGLAILAAVGIVFLRPNSIRPNSIRPDATPPDGAAPRGRAPAGIQPGDAIGPEEPKFYASEPVAAHLSPAVRDLPVVTDQLYLDREINPRHNPNLLDPDMGKRGTWDRESVPLDPLAADSVNWAGRTPSLDFSFEGISNPTGCNGCTPPDVVGDVGPDHYVHMVNVKFAIYNKSGSLLAGPTNFNELFTGTGGYCEDANDGDPVPLYDPLADRWLLSQFTVRNPYKICVAISQTPDPTGAYYLYEFSMSNGLPDYFKFGVWPDAYYMSANESSYSAYAFDRTSMLAGAPATFQRFGGQTNFLLPADLDGATPPPAGSPGYFYTFKDGSYHGGTDRVELFQFDVDWATPANSTFTLINTFYVAPFTYTPCGFFQMDCILQLGSSEGFDALCEWPMFRFPYRHFDTHQTLLGVYGIGGASGEQGAAPRWFELRNSGSGWTLYQEGTYDPDDGHDRVNASIAMDGAGNIALGYTVSSSSMYPAIGYATRLASDPLGTMGPEMILWAGTGSQTSTYNRWGDYSAMSVDPANDCSFWHINEYYTSISTSNWHTRVGVFTIDECLSPDFGIDVTPASLDVCAPDDAVYNVEVSQQNGFGDPVSLSASGHPAGTTALFGANPVTPPGSSTLTIGDTGSAAAGSYEVDILGTAAGPLVHQDTVTLNLYDSAPAAAGLSAPADGASDQSTTPALSWQPAAGAASYGVEIASDPAFANIVDSASGLAGSNYTPAPLDPNTVYYWRVWANNPCGSAPSATWSFRTQAMSCTTYNSSDVPKNIQDASVFSPRTTTSVLSVPAGTAIADLNVVNLAGTHAYIGDLDFALDSPAATRVVLIPRMCGSATNFDKDLDDEAVDALACPLDDGATQQPSGSLSDFDGQASGGTWTLRITDNSRRDTGELASWGLEVCTGSSYTTADYSDLASSYGIAWHSGDGALRLGPTWTADTTFAAGDDDASDDGVTFPDNLFPGYPSTVRVNVQGTPASGRWLRLWFDWNEDGAFDTAELEYDGAVAAGDNDITVDVPAGLIQGINFRARLYDSAGAPTALMAQDAVSYGAATGGEVEDGIAPLAPPTAVTLASFTATPAGGTIQLAWQTTSDASILGFHLYRAGTPDGPPARLTADPIDVLQPGSSVGAAYTWTDGTPLPGVTYYYWLEILDVGGLATRHGPLPALVPPGLPFQRYLPLVLR